jgi:hypothetical protein
VKLAVTVSWVVIRWPHASVMIGMCSEEYYWLEALGRSPAAWTDIGRLIRPGVADVLMKHK